MHMKVIGIVGSPRAKGNTEYLVNEALSLLKKEGIDVEMIKLCEKNVAPCEACIACGALKNCKIEDDFQEIFSKIEEADGIIVGSPVYYGSATPQIMSLLDRAAFISMQRGGSLRHKAGAAIAVARRAGANFTFAQLNYFFLYNEMIVPGSTSWNVAYAQGLEDVKKDEEGLQTIRNMAANMAWLLKKLHSR